MCIRDRLPVWQGLNRVINEYLDGITLQDILDQQQERYSNDYIIWRRLFNVTKGFLYHKMERISKESGVKKICVHDIRHSHASLLIDLNTNILLIIERFGHEDVETTLEIYGHLYPHKDEEVAGRLEKLCVWDKKNDWNAAVYLLCLPWHKEIPKTQ